jgi:ribosomal protein S18 acetylase RimI-like enzyme
VGDVRIERVGAERLDDVEHLWKAMQAHHVEVGPDIPGIPPRPPDESWPIRRARYEGWLAGPDAFLLLALDGDEAVGYALVSFHDRDDTHRTGERTAELHSLAVAPSRRGAGTGTRLLRAVYAEVRAARVGEMMIGVMAGNDRALALYEREGFRPWVTMTLGRVPEG